MPAYVPSTIRMRPGIQVSTSVGGENPGVTNYWTDSDGFRFVDDWPETMEGTFSITFLTTNIMAVSVVTGVCRGRPYYYNDGTNNWIIFGTTTGLYTVSNTTFQPQIYNITPLQTSGTAIANSLATQFDTLGSNPVSTLSIGNPTILITHTNHGLRSGDSVTIANVSGTIGGISSANINGTRTITLVNSNSYTVTAGANASSVASGGGASVTVGTGAITVTHASHGMSANQRVKFSGAADTGGILAANINREFMIRSVPTANTYVVVGSATATSAVSSGGGASTLEYAQESAGIFADGTYSTVWSFAKSNNSLVACPGQRRKVYSWAGNIAVAPTAVTNAPTDVDFIFMMNGKLGAITGNRIRNSNTGDITDWTLAAGSQAYDDYKEEVSSFTSYAIIGNRVVLASRDSISALDDIGGDDVWSFSVLSRNDGVVSLYLMLETGGIIYLVSGHKFKRINGSYIEPIPGNSLEAYFKDNIGYLDTEFISFNPTYNELMVHFGSNASNTTSFITYNISNGSFSPSFMPMTAASYDVLNSRLVTINAAGSISAMTIASYVGSFGGSNFYIESNFAAIGEGNNMMLLHGMEIAGIASGTIDLTVTVRNSLNDSDDETVLGPISVDLSSGLGRIMFGPIRCRYRKYRFEVTSGNFTRLSGWKDLIQATGSKF